MDTWEWVLAGVVVVVFAFIILRPDRWNTRTRRRSDGGTTVGVDGTSRRDRDNDNDNDGDGGSDGGGDGGGGGGD